MTAWGDESVLNDLVDRQFAHFVRLAGSERLLFLPRLLHFVESDPRLGVLLIDLQHEGNAVLANFRSAQTKVRTELAALWAKHKDEILARLKTALDEDKSERTLHAYCSIENYEGSLTTLPAASFAERGSVSALESDTERLINALKQWRSWATSRAEEQTEALSEELGRLEGILEEVHNAHRYACRELHLASRNLGGPAVDRLRGIATLLHPVPPTRERGLTEESLIEFVRFREAGEFSSALHEPGNASSEGKKRVVACAEEVVVDAKLLHEELHLRIGLGRSRIALVRRYAARCEAFDAERLRSACAKASSKAERILTIDFARFLFDAGLTPILDGTASGLRPDVLHVEPSSLFYVEAKQYAGKNPKAQIKKAYSQVWSTWARLRKTYPCNEAFLVVFRRAGSYAELPPIIRHAGLRLYSVLADISTEAGSKEKSPMIRITEADLRPKGEGDG